MQTHHPESQQNHCLARHLQTGKLQCIQTLQGKGSPGSGERVPVGDGRHASTAVSVDGQSAVASQGLLVRGGQDLQAIQPLLAGGQQEQRPQRSDWQPAWGDPRM